MMRSTALAALLLSSTAASAGLMLSANDGKQIVKGDPTPRTPDSVDVLDMGHYPPRVIGSVHVPAAMIGSPNAVAVGPGTLTPVAQVDSCHWAQGLAWSDDGKLVLQQCAAERVIQTFRFDGSSLVRDESATLTFVSRPGSLSTQHSR